MGGWQRDCWGPGLCRWGSPPPAWVLVKTPRGSDSWFSLLYQEFARSELASLSRGFQAHLSRTSRRSSNRLWKRWPGRPRRWTFVPKTEAEGRKFTERCTPLWARSSPGRKTEVRTPSPALFEGKSRPGEGAWLRKGSWSPFPAPPSPAPHASSFSAPVSLPPHKIHRGI